jgi:hypothetical protein
MVDFAPGNTLDVSGVAAMCHVHEVTVRRWFRQGQLQSWKIGGRVLTTIQAVQNAMKPVTSEPLLQNVSLDRETLAALKSLKARGNTFKDDTDGNKATATVGR